jgi:hypothetical protein
MVDYVKKQLPNANLLEEYIEAIEAGKFEALETVYQKLPTAAKNVQQAKEKLTKEHLPVDLPILSKESSRKHDREPAANIESEPPPKKSRQM